MGIYAGESRIVGVVNVLFVADVLAVDFVFESFAPAEVYQVEERRFTIETHD